MTSHSLAGRAVASPRLVVDVVEPGRLLVVESAIVVGVVVFVVVIDVRERGAPGCAPVDARSSSSPNQSSGVWSGNGSGSFGGAGGTISTDSVSSEAIGSGGASFGEMRGICSVTGSRRSAPAAGSAAGGGRGSCAPAGRRGVADGQPPGRRGRGGARRLRAAAAGCGASAARLVIGGDLAGPSLGGGSDGGCGGRQPACGGGGRRAGTGRVGWAARAAALRLWTAAGVRGRRSAARPGWASACRCPTAPAR